MFVSQVCAISACDIPQLAFRPFRKWPNDSNAQYSMNRRLFVNFCDLTPRMPRAISMLDTFLLRFLSRIRKFFHFFSGKNEHQKYGSKEYHMIWAKRGIVTFTCMRILWIAINIVHITIQKTCTLLIWISYLHAISTYSVVQLTYKWNINFWCMHEILVLETMAFIDVFIVRLTLSESKRKS